MEVLSERPLSSPALCLQTWETQVARATTPVFTGGSSGATTLGKSFSDSNTLTHEVLVVRVWYIKVFVQSCFSQKTLLIGGFASPGHVAGRDEHPLDPSVTSLYYTQLILLLHLHPFSLFLCFFYTNLNLSKHLWASHGAMGSCLVWAETHQTT